MGRSLYINLYNYIALIAINRYGLLNRYDIYDAISADDVDTPTSSRHPSGSTRTDEGEAGPVDEATDANSSRDETLLNVNVKVTDVETSSAVQSRATVPSLSGDGRSVIEIEDSDSDEDFVPKSVAKVAIKGQSKKKTNVKKVNKSKPKIAKKIIKKGTAKKVIKKKAVKKNANRVSKKNVNRRNK